MKTSIENINGQDYTVVWYEPKDEVDHIAFAAAPDGARYGITKYGYRTVAVMLPALPRNPKPEDAPLLYRYMAEGLMPTVTGYHLPPFELSYEVSEPFLYFDEDGCMEPAMDGDLTHATDADGNKIEVAIEESE